MSNAKQIGNVREGYPDLHQFDGAEYVRASDYDSRLHASDVYFDSWKNTEAQFNQQKLELDAACGEIDILTTYSESKEHELYEAQFPLDPGVEWRPEVGRAGAYCVFIDREGGFWSTCNSAFHAQQQWTTWKVCAMSRALKVLP